MQPPEASFGLAASLPRTEAQRLADALEELWEASIGPLRSVAADLEALKRFFDPVASSRRLRKALAELPPTPTTARALEPPLVLRVDDAKLLITPEGRVALDILRDLLLTGEDPLLADAQRIARAQKQLLDVYTKWSRHRLDQTLDLLSGKAEPLRYPAIGFVLVLLVNRSVDRKHALPGSDEIERARVVEPAVLNAAAVFARHLGAENLRTDRESLYRGWWAGEARRRLPGLQVRDGIWLSDDQEGAALQLVARELARRELDATRVAEAFDALVADFRDRLPELAQLGLAFERPPETRRLRERLLEEFQSAVTLRDRSGDAVVSAR